ncbi:MAG: hypothetical protein NTV01_10755 [Bacteroidia bacterium]|nr:hypothetical protein [Bacteroidia bacterium]
MKKIFALLIVASFFIGSVSLQSCKKCSTCTYTYSILGINQTYSFPETCGKTSEIDAYIQACQDAAALVGGTCGCT